MLAHIHPAGDHAAIAGRGTKAKRPGLENNDLASGP